MSAHETLLVHPQPVDKTAALHIAGGDKARRDELLWAQHDAFERALTEARLRNMADVQARRQALHRNTGRYIEGHGEAVEKYKELTTKHPRSFATSDWRKHMTKLRRKCGATGRRYASAKLLKGARVRGKQMERFVDRVTP